MRTKNMPGESVSPFRPKTRFLGVSLAVCLLCVWVLGGQRTGTSDSTAFTGTELLGRPTDSSITINVVADASIDAYFEYGTSSGVYDHQTAVSTYLAGTPVVVTLSDLQPNTRYYYRMLYRPASEGSFIARSEHTFHTQRPPGAAFTFAVQADSHIWDKKGNLPLYTITEQNESNAAPDFMIDLGDTFGDDSHPDTETYEMEDALHLNQRPFMGIVGCSAPVFLVLGNHDAETGYYLDETPPSNLTVYATEARQKYFPNPVPDGFYTGNSTKEDYVGYPGNYYAWQWGDALFVVLDPFRYTAADPQTASGWDWTLGEDQYDWLKQTLEDSTARFKFVFIHHLVGGLGGHRSRGGAEGADLYEWGGHNGDGTWGFTDHRPGWEEPVGQLLSDNGVTIVFHGHDHLYARDALDGMTYQEVPMPDDATYDGGGLNGSAFYPEDSASNSGYLRVEVTRMQVEVDYVRSFLPGDGTNGEVAASYEVESQAPLAGFAVSAESATATVPVTFADSSGNGPTSWSWAFGDGGTSDLQNPSHTYVAAGEYTVSLTVRNAYGADTASAEISVAPRVAITAVSKATNPFRLKVLGSGFQPGCTVMLNNEPAPETKYKSESKVVAKKGNSLKALLPKGVPVSVVVVNPDGGTSSPVTFTR